jgi:hypothetical protein
MPFLQLSPLPQTAPQPPQLAGSPRMEVQAAPQRTEFSHVVPQCPFEHTSPAAQAWAH